jgi:hypothetical protein
LEGLLKIPFGIYRKEPILTFMDEIKKIFVEISKNDSFSKIVPNIPSKEKYTSIEIVSYLNQLKENVIKFQ